MITTVLPIFLVILVGFIFAKREKFSSEAEQLINSYVLNIALPALLFLAVARADIQELMNWSQRLAKIPWDHKVVPTLFVPKQIVGLHHPLKS